MLSEYKKLSIEQCKKLLKEKNYTDEQIEEIRDGLYHLASLLVDEYLAKKKNNPLTECPDDPKK